MVSEDVTRFETLVREVADPVRRYLLRRVDAAVVDDVLSETLLVLWRRIEEVPEEPIAWSIGIARNQLLNATRSRRRAHRLTDLLTRETAPRVGVRVSGQDSSDPLADATRRAFSVMRGSDVEILRLWIWEELEPKQIAEVLGIGTNAATVRLHRARRRFAEAFCAESPHLSTLCGDRE